MSGRHNFSSSDTFAARSDAEHYARLDAQAKRWNEERKNPDSQYWVAALEMWKGMANKQIKDAYILETLAAATYPTIQAESEAYANAVIAYQRTALQSRDLKSVHQS